jgi:hypothetical protein
MSNPKQSQADRKRPPSVLAKIALDDGLARGFCPICYAARKSLRRYLHSFLYEGMMSPLARQEFLDSKGFCREHFWEAKAIEEECWAEGIGVSILCENLLEISLQGLESLAKKQTQLARRLFKIRGPAQEKRTRIPLLNQDCPACRVANDAESHYLSILGDLLDDRGFGERFSKSAGLCLRHSQAAWEEWSGKNSAEIVRQVAEKRIRLLLNELREFQRKHDYRYQHEPRGSEWSSPGRAIEFLVGLRTDRQSLGELQPARKSRR